MKIIAVIEADFERGALGTRSRLREELMGETVLRRTLKRARAAAGVASVHLVVEASQEKMAREAASGLDVAVETHSAGAVPWAAYVRSSRKWSLDAWRGGIGGSTVFDETLNPWVLEALARREGADGVAAIPAAAPLFDARLLDRMIAYYEQVRQDVRMVFTQSAPGLSAAIYMPSMLADLAKAGHPLAKVMAYRPADPQRDMVMQSCFYASDAVIAHAVGRCVADTDAAVKRVAAILRECEGTLNTETVSRWLNDHRYACVESLPAEVEIELTTDDPLPASTLRPRGQALERRGCMNEKLFARIIAELAGRDDVRVVLGGFGDSLMHPSWPALVSLCRAKGIFAVAVRTPAVHLDEPAVQHLIDARVDVLNVLLDASTAETYRRLHGADHFDRVRANLDRVFEAHRHTKQPLPLVVCEMIKTRETMGEMEAFYDYWIQRGGAAVITGPSTYAGQWPDRSVMRMAPPTRFPCGRIFSRAMVLADGRVTVCDQDFRGRHAIGTLVESSLSELWSGRTMAAVRESHVGGSYQAMPLCAACEEWHRP